ncbi:MAG: glycosyltransferase [Marinibacterium sp.]
MSKHDFSVIIPSVNSFDDLQGCVQALLQQDGSSPEIIVVDRLGEQVRHKLELAFPDITLIRVAPGTTIPMMRHEGFRAATTPAVAVIEDHVIVPPDWGRRMLGELAKGHDVVAGAFENAATETLVDWAAFLTEYCHGLPPLPEGPVGGVPGNNVIYRKEVLDRYMDVTALGKWENYLHDAMKADGIELIMRPDIVVGHKMHYTFGLYFSQRYIYSRAYAGMRVVGEGLPKKIAMGGAAFALPPLMFVRTVQTLRKKGKHMDWFAKSIPMIAAFCVAWGAGEVAGYWFGPKDALSKVR